MAHQISCGQPYQRTGG